MSILSRLTNGWNAFMGRDPTPKGVKSMYGFAYSEPYSNALVSTSRYNAKDMINAALNRIAVDVAALHLEHARVDAAKRYKEPIDSYLNDCLTVTSNIDQTARAFRQDAVMTMLTEGVAAIVPVYATTNPMETESYDILELRVGSVTKWFPHHVQVSLYNEDIGKREAKVFPKHMVAIVENPFYEIMNKKNSNYQMLLTKLRQLDTIDRESSSGKLDLIIQVPYSTRSETHKIMAENRRNDIEKQLNGSHLGVAYIDGTEKVIQLNRAVENNLFTQVDYYTNRLFAQLGIPKEVFEGTATEAVMLNYQNQTLEPILAALVDAMNWKFLSQKARSHGQAILYFNEPFKFATASEIANNADKFIRNEILTKNEFRQILGFKPSDDPNADRLSNPNMPEKDKIGGSGETEEIDEKEVIVESKPKPKSGGT